MGFFEETKLLLASTAAYHTGHPVPFPSAHLGVWWNVWDHNDFLSFTADGIVAQVDDSSFDGGMSLLAAHSGYLQRPSFYRALATRLPGRRGPGLEGPYEPRSTLRTRAVGEPCLAGGYARHLCRRYWGQRLPASGWWRGEVPETFGLGQLRVSALTAYEMFRWLSQGYRADGCPLAMCWLLLSPTRRNAPTPPTGQQPDPADVRPLQAGAALLAFSL